MSIPFFSKLRSQKHYLQLVKPELKQVSEFVEAQASCFDPEVTDYMETVCQSKGKMLRPALVLLVAGATGGIKEAHIRLGALLEMVHLASLVHDDVIDEADKRRDEATANALWGNSLAVLLGDVLFSHAMVLGTEFGSTEFCRRLANTVRDVCQGEVAQSSRLYDLSMTREEYFEIIRKNRLPVLRRYGRRGVDLRSGPGSGGIPLPAGRPAGGGLPDLRRLPGHGGR